MSVARAGGFIASGGGDKTVNVWNWDLAQKYTFTHADSIQALAFNPVTHNLLASASATDFAIWSMPSTTLKKHKLPSRCCCAAWSSDGQTLALGLHSGVVSLRGLSGAETAVVRRGAPVWDVCWAPAKGAGGGGGGEAADVLSVACWDGTLSFFTADGAQWGKDRPAPNGGDPCSVRPFGGSGGDYLVVAGSDRKATLVTRDGVKLSTVAEGRGWLWRAVARPGANAVAVAGNDGTVALHTVTFATVHGLYGDRYASREACTEVVVRHLVSDARVRIKCRDYVKKVAVYRDRVAVQLPDRIVIYEAVGVEAGGGGGGAPAREAASASPAATMMYRKREEIRQALECNLLVVTSGHVLLCVDRKLALYSFSGTREHEWELGSVIRYIKVVGGPPGGEGLLVGLKSGEVLKVFINNPFPIPLLKHTSAIRCLDMSMSRRKLALVDELSSLYVYDCITGEPLWSELNAASVAWNAEFEDMLAFSGGGTLSIKTGTFPVHAQKMAGFVVGFAGSRAFVLQAASTVTVDVPQSASARAFADAGEWEQAYRVACMGVTHADWRELGVAALKALQLGVARAAFLRTHPPDMRYIELINHFEAVLRARGTPPGGGPAAAPAAGEASDAALLAEVLAYGGAYGDAAKAHLAAGTVEKALEMFIDLRLWSEARRFAEEVGAGRVDVSNLLRKQAAWCEDSGDVVAAATIYAGLGQAARAVALLAERGQWEQLLALVRTLPSAPPRALLLSAAAAAAAAGGGEGGAGRSRSGSVDSTGSSVDVETLAASLGAAGGGEEAGGLSRDVAKALRDAGAHFAVAGRLPAAREVYGKLGDVASLVQLHVDSGAWGEALALANGALESVRAALGAAPPPGAEVEGIAAAAAGPHLLLGPRQAAELAAARELVSHVHLSRGDWLAGADRFEEALRAYESAGRPELTSRILSQLAASAVEEDRFSDASLHFLRLSRDAWAVLERRCGSSSGGGGGGGGGAPLEALAARYRRFSFYADVYAAYALVYEEVAMPFSLAEPARVLSACKYLLNAVAGGTCAPGGGLGAPGRLPHRVSLARVLYATAKLALALGAAAHARWALDRLSRTLLLPPNYRNKVDEMLLAAAAATGGGDAAGAFCGCPRCGVLQPAVAAKAAGVAAAVPGEALGSWSDAPLARAGPGGGSPGGACRASVCGEGAGGGGGAAAQSFSPFSSPWYSAYSGDACTSCGAPFTRCAITFEVLPLVEFAPVKGVDLAAALAALAEDPDSDGGAALAVSAPPAAHAGVAQSLSFGSAGRSGAAAAAPPPPPPGAGGRGEVDFKALMAATGEAASEARASGVSDAPAGEGAVPLGVVPVPLPLLRALRPADVYVVRAPTQMSLGGRGGAGGGGGGSGTVLQLAAAGTLAASPAELRGAPPRFFFHTAPADVALSMSAACGRFFHAEELEFQVLANGSACRERPSNHHIAQPRPPPHCANRASPSPTYPPAVCPFSKAPASALGL